MKGVSLALFAAAALIASADDAKPAAGAKATAIREAKLTLQTGAPPRAAYPFGVPCVGYAADPKAGDESAAVACRRAGAWLFRTSVCDDATLAFCDRYGLRLFLVVDGERPAIVETLSRLAKSPHRKAVAAVQLGADPSGGKDPKMWRNLAALVVKRLPGVTVALPVRDLKSRLYAEMRGYLGPVTHLAVDLRGESAPYAKLEQIAGQLRAADDKSVSKLRLWVVGPGRLAGTPDDGLSTPAAIAWQMHWIMSAFASDRTAGVFVERPYRADAFGQAMRSFWATTTLSRSLIGHGESATCAAFAPKPVRSVDSDLSMEDEALDTLELNDPHAAGPAPVACANVVAGRKGDVEYLVFRGDYNLKPEEDEHRIGIVLVNTTGERVKVVVDIDRRGGAASSGFRRRLVPDAGTDTMTYSVDERTGKPVTEIVEPGEVTFFDFRV